MPVYSLGPKLLFPPPAHAEEGLLAVGGDLRPERLLLAYASGIFPWYGEGSPILWHSPDPRCVIRTDGIRVNRSLRRVINHRDFEIRFDTVFTDVIHGCRLSPRPMQDGTWITEEMEEAYIQLHELGFAHSAEAFRAGELVGGVYGVSLGSMFFGESMFSRAPNASKVALVALATKIHGWGFKIIDAQVANDHTLSLGAEEWSRETFLAELKRAMAAPTRRGAWTSL